MTPSILHIRHPPQLPVVLVKGKTLYVRFSEVIKHFPKTARFTLGAKIDEQFLFILESVFVAAYQKQDEKIVTLGKAITRLDTLKFLLSIAYEARFIALNHYAHLSEGLDEIGKMLGGWKKGLDAKNSRP